MTKRNKAIGITSILAIAVILIVSIVGICAYVSAQEVQDYFTIDYKTGDGSIITPGQAGMFPFMPVSMIGENFGITDMRFNIKMVNTGSVPITVRIDSLSPFQLNDALAGGREQALAVGETKVWTTDWITTSQFEGATPKFEVVSKAYDDLGREKTKASAIELTIMPDPGMDYTVDIIDSEGEGSSTDPDDTPSTCENECHFFNQLCVGNDVYSCVLGADGCMNLQLHEDCGDNMCVVDMCKSSDICSWTTLTLTSYPMPDYLQESCCTFDCTDSLKDCITHKQNSAGYVSLGTQSKGTSQIFCNAYDCSIEKCL